MTDGTTGVTMTAKSYPVCSAGGGGHRKRRCGSLPYRSLSASTASAAVRSSPGTG